MRNAQRGRFTGRALFLCSCLMASGWTAADDSFSELAEDRVWLKLLYYERDGSSPSGWQSASVSDAFFLAQDGRTNPQAELRATVEAMSEPPGPDLNEHSQCRFPARYFWLKQQGELATTTESPLVC